MPNLNKVQLMGNLTRDPETKYTPRGTAATDFGLAINRQWKDDAGETKEETTFVDLIFFGKTAETIGKYCHKGNPLYVEGRLQLDQWEDKTTGQQRSRLKVVGETFQFLSSGQKSEKREEAPKTAIRQDQTGHVPSSAVSPPMRKTEVSDDDIPL
jgi:single-strand DNA-binding protein